MKTKLLLIAALLLIAGAANGIMDALWFHGAWQHFDNPAFWNPAESWVNKWAIDMEGNPVAGKERFWGSSRWFVAVTDGWHLCKFVQLLALKLAILAAIVIPVDADGRIRFIGFDRVTVLVIVLFFIGITLALSAGFHLTYSWIF